MRMPSLARLGVALERLPDGACELMRSWIQPFQSEAILGSKKESSPAAKSRKRTLADAKERPSSLLWGFASGFLPRGNYSLLHAITMDTYDATRRLRTTGFPALKHT